MQTWREESNGSLSLVKLDYFGAGSRYVPIPLYAPNNSGATRSSVATPTMSTNRHATQTATMHYDTIRGSATPQHVVHHTGKHSKGIKRPFEDISSASSVGSSRAADAVEQLENYPGKYYLITEHTIICVI